MYYPNITEGIFLSRPNRFVAICRVDGTDYRCHVKNTGRCRELLVPGVTVYLQDRRAAGQATAFSLIAVRADGQIINIDSQAPNAVVKEALLSGRLTLPGFEEPTLVRPEFSYGQSRLDFLVAKGDRRALCEVKGVTLKVGSGAYFPDAPTERGVKHLHELTEAAGFERFIIFVIQMKGVTFLAPNDSTHPQFGEALRQAAAAGVGVLAFDCKVGPDSLDLDESVRVDLSKFQKS